METKYIIEMNGISKRFGGVQALKNVQLQILPGEVHALMGENGAGKSTLMKILGGAYTCTEGTIKLVGKEVRFRSPVEAIQQGIAVVYQEQALVDSLSVADNILLGRYPNKCGWIRRKEMLKIAKDALDAAGADLDLNEEAGKHTVAQKQFIEIAKALSMNAKVDTKLYLCHYCGAHGSAAIYAGKGRKLGDPLVKFPTATGSNSSCPPSEKPHGDPEQGALTQKQIEWCRDVRHIPPEVLVEAGVAFASISMPISGKEKGWEKRDCLCFNFFENGELVNTKFRDSQKHFKLLQGARTIPYNIDAIRDTPECILVEGEFDALSYMAVGRTDVISVPNGANSQLDWLDELSESHFEQKQVIYLSVDTDRKGRELCRELSRRLGVDRCRIVTYGEAYKDANELLVAVNYH